MRMFATLAALLLLNACSFHTHCTDFSGIPGVRGEASEYQLTSTWALHGLFVFPLIGDATLPATVKNFTEEANTRGARRVNVEMTTDYTYWWILPPISFFLHPVNTTVEGYVEAVAPPEETKKTK